MSSDNIPKVFFNGKAIVFSPDPESVQGTLMVPGFDLFRVLYGEPIWDEESKTIGIQEEGFLFLIQDGNKIANLNDQAYPLPVAPIMKEGKLMVPLEVVAQVLGYRYQWDGNKTTATVWLDDIPSGPSDKAGLLVGLWSSSDYYGEMYDPGSGAPVGSAYDGEWYLFRGDGSYRYVIVGSGFAISGAVVQEGSYKLEGNDLLLFNIKSSWYPDPARPNQSPGYENRPADNERVSIMFNSPTQVKIADDTFYFHGD